MALTSTQITPIELDFNTKSDEILAGFAAVASDGEINAAYIDMGDYEDRRVLILIKNENGEATAKDAWLLGGNGLQAGEDIAFEDIAAAGAEIFSCVIESGAYVNTSGDYKGYAVVKGESTDIQVAAVVLP